jgi:UDP-glucose 4-epimerase
MQSAYILLTGGMGYIGSHTCVSLLEYGHNVVILDNLSNSRLDTLEKIEMITGKRPVFVHGDVRDSIVLKKIFTQYPCLGVIHFAGLKAVGESVEKPLLYYDHNVVGSLRLFECMKEFGINQLVFSSSATVYGIPQTLPLSENHPLSATNPYGRTKLIIEEILRDYFISNPNWKIGILRYFNPVGAHPSGLIGEAPQGIPNNLMPYVSQVATGQRPYVNVWGNDYPTPDGTGVRDYIHVVDLALGHLKMWDYLNHNAPQCTAINLGTGTGYSVLDLIQTFEKVSRKKIPYQIANRRAGDVASNYADPTLAFNLLGWKTQRDLLTMCQDAWNWQSNEYSRKKSR